MSSDAVTIRMGGIDDAEGIAASHVSSWKYAYAGHLPAELLDKIDLGERASRWRAIIGAFDASGSYVVVALVDQVVIGHASVRTSNVAEYDTRRYFELSSIYLSPEFIGRGIGASLLGAAISALPEDAVGMTLWVLRDNARARRFYERHGFAPEGRADVAQLLGVSLPEVLYVRHFY